MTARECAASISLYMLNVFFQTFVAPGQTQPLMLKKRKPSKAPRQRKNKKKMIFRRTRWLIDISARQSARRDIRSLTERFPRQQSHGAAAFKSRLHLFTHPCICIAGETGIIA